MEADALDDGEPLLFDRGRFCEIVDARVEMGSSDGRAA